MPPKKPPRSSDLIPPPPVEDDQRLVRRLAETFLRTRDALEKMPPLSEEQFSRFAVECRARQAPSEKLAQSATDSLTADLRSLVGPTVRGETQQPAAQAFSRLIDSMKNPRAMARTLATRQAHHPSLGSSTPSCSCSHFGLATTIGSPWIGPIGFILLTFVIRRLRSSSR